MFQLTLQEASLSVVLTLDCPGAGPGVCHTPYVWSPCGAAWYGAAVWENASDSGGSNAQTPPRNVNCPAKIRSLASTGPPAVRNPR